MYALERIKAHLESGAKGQATQIGNALYLSFPDDPRRLKITITHPEAHHRAFTLALIHTSNGPIDEVTSTWSHLPSVHNMAQLAITYLAIWDIPAN